MTSADLTELLRASRPVAPDALRERVRAIAAATPAAPSALSRFRLPRLRLVVPALAATAIAAAALIAVVRPGTSEPVFAAAKQSTPPRTLTAPPTRRSARPRATGPQQGSSAPAATSGAPAGTRAGSGAGNRPRRRLPGADRARGQGRRRALERHRPGAADRARSRRLHRLGRVRLVPVRIGVADPPRPDREGAGRDRPADGARQDHLAAGADP